MKNLITVIFLTLVSLQSYCFTEDLIYKDGELVIASYYNTDTGQLEREEHYKDNMINVEVSTWHENGQLESVKNYTNDLLNGQSTYYWYEDGQKLIDGSYKYEKPDGKWTIWNENGMVLEELNYKDGNLIDRTIFKYSFFTNQLKSKQNYKNKRTHFNCRNSCT